MACTLTEEQIKSVKPRGFLHNKGTNAFNARVITVNGKITSAQAKTIAEAAEKYGCGELEFTTRLTVEVRGIEWDYIDAFCEYISQAGLYTGGTGTLVRPVVSCKGTTCQYGLCDTFALSEKIHEKFYLGYRTVKLPHKFKIAVGGCPNNCVKPDLNDLGIVGQRIMKLDENVCKGCKKCAIQNMCPVKASKVENGILTTDREICNNCGRCIGKCPFGAVKEETYGYKIYIGGRWGKKVTRGQALSKIFTSEEEMLAVAEKVILLYREQGIPGERFADTIDRIGFENVERQVMSNELLERKQTIIG